MHVVTQSFSSSRTTTASTRSTTGLVAIIFLTFSPSATSTHVMPSKSLLSRASLAQEDCTGRRMSNSVPPIQRSRFPPPMTSISTYPVTLHHQPASSLMRDEGERWVFGVETSTSQCCGNRQSILGIRIWTMETIRSTCASIRLVPSAPASQ
ncbi:hypothetical protein B0H14DRAFT_1355352 [Mycena olivaceomarginata]|nr:hypothetical protein B0H14DRAFT_1355352 [Mycena olivaceomarginata]